MDDGLASDFVALWQSELTAMAADRELRESWAAFLALWANAAIMLLAAGGHAPHDATPGSAGAAEPAGAAALGIASWPGMAEVEQLHRRIAELERRLAEPPGGGVPPAG